MDEPVISMRPQVRKAFNGAVDRRQAVRDAQAFELCFREVSAEKGAGGVFFEKIRDKN